MSYFIMSIWGNSLQALTIFQYTLETVASGSKDSNNAAIPEIIGAAKEVPLKTSYSPFNIVVNTFTPGATKSRFFHNLHRKHAHHFCQ